MLSYIGSMSRPLVLQLLNIRGIATTSTLCLWRLQWPYCDILEASSCMSFCVVHWTTSFVFT